MTNKKVMFKPLSPKIEAVVNEHGKNPADILEILVDLQTTHGGLTPETLDDLARSLDIPPARVYGIASFYSMLDISEYSYASTMPKVRVCDGPVCWLCGSNFESATQLIRKTHAEWQVNRTSCLGLCDRAPAILIENDQVGPVKADEINPSVIGVPRKPIKYEIPRPGEVRVILENAGKIDPSSLESALLVGAYQGLQA